MSLLERLGLSWFFQNCWYVCEPMQLLLAESRVLTRDEERGTSWQFPMSAQPALRAWGIVRVRDVVGASGGAASAILALADPEKSSRSSKVGRG